MVQYTDNSVLSWPDFSLFYFILSINKVLSASHIYFGSTAKIFTLILEMKANHDVSFVYI